MNNPNPIPGRKPLFQAFWPGGANSGVDPLLVPPSQYQRGWNVLNHGGILSTRPPCRLRIELPIEDYGKPQGMTWFTPKNSLPIVVFVMGGRPYYATYPYRTSDVLPVPGCPLSEEPKFWPNARRVALTTCLKNVNQTSAGELVIIDPFPVLMMGDGIRRNVAWDGLAPVTVLQPMPPTYGPAPSNLTFWSNDRFVFAVGNKLFLGDILDPYKVTESLVTAEGGYFAFPTDITMLGETPDRSSLLVSTETETYSLQTSIRDRTKWQTTPGFQSRLLPNIGCVAPRSFVNQFGLSGWYSAGGWIFIDAALNTNRSSVVTYDDRAMERASKDHLCPDKSNICVGLHENYLLCSVPFGSNRNGHTWVLDENAGNGRAWAGVWTGFKPVQWSSCVVNGKLRTFFLSDDRDITDPSKGYNIWEAFSDDLEENGQRVPAKVETAPFMSNFAPETFRYAEIEVDSVCGPVDFKVSVSGRTAGGYTSILEKHMLATVGPFADPTMTDYPDFTTAGIINDFRGQTRILRTKDFSVPIGGNNESQCLEGDGRPMGSDKGFTFLLEWEGNMKVRAIRVFVDPYAEPMTGRAEKDETSDYQPLTTADQAHEPIYSAA